MADYLWVDFDTTRLRSADLSLLLLAIPVKLPYITMAPVQWQHYQIDVAPTPSRCFQAKMSNGRSKCPMSIEEEYMFKSTMIKETLATSAHVLSSVQINMLGRCYAPGMGEHHTCVKRT